MKLVLCLSVLFLVSSLAQAQLFGSKNCQYSFTVPNGGCATGNQGIDKKLAAVKQDLDRTRLQYVSSNSVVQNSLNALQGQTHNYMKKVDDLQNQLQKLEASVNMLGKGTGPSGPVPKDISKLIQQTKDDFNKVLHDVQNRISNLNSQFQKDAVDQSKIHSAIELQVNTQASEVSQASQKIKDLEKQLQAIKTSGTGAGNPTLSPGNLSKLDSQVKQLEQEIKQFDALQQSQFNGLENKVNQALTNLSFVGHEVDNANVTAHAAIQRLANAETRIQTNHDDFVQFRQQIDPQVQQINSIKQKVTTLQTGLGQVGTNVANAQVKAIQDAAKMNDLKVQAGLLAMQVKNMQNKLTGQAGAILNLNIKMPALTALVPQVTALEANVTAEVADLKKLLANLQTKINSRPTG